MLCVECLEVLINLIPLCEIGTLLIAGTPTILYVHYVSVTTKTQAVKLINAQCLPSLPRSPSAFLSQ